METIPEEYHEAYGISNSVLKEKIRGQIMNQYDRDEIPEIEEDADRRKNIRVRRVEGSEVLFEVTKRFWRYDSKKWYVLVDTDTDHAQGHYSYSYRSEKFETHGGY